MVITLCALAKHPATIEPSSSKAYSDSDSSSWADWHASTTARPRSILPARQNPSRGGVKVRNRTIPLPLASIASAKEPSRSPRSIARRHRHVYRISLSGMPFFPSSASISDDPARSSSLLSGSCRGMGSPKYPSGIAGGIISPRATRSQFSPPVQRCRTVLYMPGFMYCPEARAALKDPSPARESLNLAAIAMRKFGLSFCFFSSLLCFFVRGSSASVVPAAPTRLQADASAAIFTRLECCG
mmetsp:Transcript_22549/g.62561  ORF Transcript_22549/g.62561 Transcript_22549/m.62561 type:complete len:242 (-) Transcript_22549:712-1437(-)